MKSNLHPNWQEQTVTCACGHTFVTMGPTATLQVDICSQCHPFFTGEERFVDKEGRLDKFKKKMAVSAKLRAAEQTKAKEKQAKKAAVKARDVETKSFKQILNQAKSVNDKADQVVKTTQKADKKPQDK